MKFLDRPGRLRVVTLNLDANPDRAMARLLAASKEVDRLQPEILCVQEVVDLDGTSTAELLAAMCGYKVASQSRTGEAVLTRLSVRKAWGVTLPDGGGRAGAALALVSTGCHEYLVASAHFGWGSGKENERLRQAMALDAEFASVAPLEQPRDGSAVTIGVIAGDLNAEPGAASLGWLTGKTVERDKSTLWTDAWLRGTGDGVTSDPQNMWAPRTALSVGISDPQMLPQRRIDYVLVRGYAYGRPGAPLAAEVVATQPWTGLLPSDHYGVLAELAC